MTPSDRIAQLEAELESARRDADNERSTREALDKRIEEVKVNAGRFWGFPLDAWDPYLGIATIAGVKYDVGIFRVLGACPVDTHLRIVERRDGCLVVERVREVPS